MRFELAGYEVKVVYTAEEAIEILKKYHPDAILLDLMLPKMQGGELLDILRSDPATQDIKIIILTAVNLSSNDTEMYLKKADDCFLKISIMPKDLVKKVTALIDGSKAKDASDKPA